MQSRMLPTYVYWDMSRVLHTVIFPWTDKSYPDQRLIMLLVLLYSLSKFLFRSFSLLSISIPSIVKSFSQLNFRSSQMFSPSKIPTGMTFVFDILHFRPDISQNKFRISTVFTLSLPCRLKVYTYSFSSFHQTLIWHLIGWKQWLLSRLLSRLL